MSAIPLLRAGGVLPFVKFLNRMGSPTERLLRQAKLPVFALDDPEALFPAYQAFLFAEQAAQFEKNDLLGIVVAQQTEIADLGMFGQMLHQTLTLYHLLTTLKQMLSTFDASLQMWLTEDGEQVWLNHQYICPSAIQNQQTKLYALLLFLKAIRIAAGSDWHPAKIHFQSVYSRRLTEVKEFANVPLHFNQPNMAFAFPRALLSQPIKSYPGSQSATQDYYRHLQLTAPAADFAGSLQQLLHTLLKDGHPDIGLAAEASGMSIRSFQRRLAEANLNYSQIVEQVRFDQAMQLLYIPDMPVVEIALELGYTDAANFTRAFKRWAGVSPREFRRLHVNSEK